MIACLDVDYSADSAYAAAVVIEDWADCCPVSQYIATTARPADYAPGLFYLRELQPLLAVIRKIDLPIGVFVIDGYCHLSSNLDPGLGAHLSHALGGSAAVVGVAKNRYGNTRHAIELVRGSSVRPLFVTAVGMSDVSAARYIASMPGGHRIPAMLKLVDRLARGRSVDCTGLFGRC